MRTASLGQGRTLGEPQRSVKPPKNSESGQENARALTGPSSLARLTPAAKPTLAAAAQAGIRRLLQPFADQIVGQHGQENRPAGKHDEPPHAEIIAPRI